MTKILLLPDRLDEWSAHNRCKALKKYIKDFDVTVAAGECDDGRALTTLNELIPKFSLVHVQFSSEAAHLLPLIYKYRNRVKIITSLIGHRLSSGHPDEVYFQRNKTPLELFSLSHATVALSPELASKYPGVRAIHIPNGIDPDLFPAFAARRCVVGHVGPRFEKPVGDYKGGDLVAEACQRLGLPTSYPGCYSPYKDDRGPYVPKQRPHDKMLDWYKTITVLVQPSVGEGCSNPIMEALSLNIPVIATRAAVIEPLHPFIARFVERGPDWDENVQNVMTALMPWAIRRNVFDSQYTWPTIAPRYEKLYHAVLEAPFDAKIESI